MFLRVRQLPAEGPTEDLDRLPDSLPNNQPLFKKAVTASQAEVERFLKDFIDLKDHAIAIVSELAQKIREAEENDVNGMSVNVWTNICRS